MNDVFISYSSKDESAAQWVKTVLEDNGISCWFAKSSLKGGDEYLKNISAEIKECKVFVLILSENVKQSPWVPKEISSAVSENKTIMPFFIEDCELNDDVYLCINNVQHFLGIWMKKKL